MFSILLLLQIANRIYVLVKNQLQKFSHNGLHDSWVATHAKVVVAAPNRHLPLVFQGDCEVISHGELSGQAIHRFKHTVSVVALLFNDLLLKKIIIFEARHCERGRGQRCQNQMKQWPNGWNPQFCLLKRRTPTAGICQGCRGTNKTHRFLASCPSTGGRPF